MAPPQPATPPLTRPAPPSLPALPALGAYNSGSVSAAAVANLGLSLVSGQSGRPLVPAARQVLKLRLKPLGTRAVAFSQQQLIAMEKELSAIVQAELKVSSACLAVRSPCLSVRKTSDWPAARRVF